MDRFYITTAIDYLNGTPHMGHAYEKCQADAFARLFKLFGFEVFFLTGSDEHGQKVAEAAQKEGISCQEQVDRVLIGFKKLLDVFGISNQDFIRTTEPRHKKVVSHFLQKLFEEGEIYLGEFTGLYCVGDERFWTEKDIQNDLCPLCSRPVIRVDEKNYFFRMGKYQDWLIDHIEKNPKFIQPVNRKNEILGKLRAEPLKDLCISRPVERVSWGIPLPFAPEFVTYVWFDALLNYVSALGPLEEGPRWKFWPFAHHVIGKDIIHTHAIYWPIMLKSMGLPQPKSIVVHGHILDGEGRKMSKSLGNVVDPFSIAQTYGGEVLRYYLLGSMRQGQDGNFSVGELENRYNAELANDFGNLVQRSLTMIHKFREGVIEKPAHFSPEGVSWLETLKNGFENSKIQGLDFNLPEMLGSTLEMIRFLNKLIGDFKPWDVAKGGTAESKEKLTEFFYVLFAGIRMSGLFLSPFLPGKMIELFVQLDLDFNLNQSTVELESFPTPHRVSTPSVLFPRLEKSVSLTPESPKTVPPKGKSEKPSKGGKELGEKGDPISFADFQKLDIRIGEILSAEAVPGSDKLILLKVNVGKPTPIQVVAGIKTSYLPEALIGKKVTVLVNLKHAKIFKIQSEGMLLATGEGDNLSLLSPEKGDHAPGSGVG